MNYKKSNYIRYITWLGIFAFLSLVSCTNLRIHDRRDGEIIEDVSNKIKSFDTDEIDFHSWSDVECSGGKIFVIDNRSTDSIIAVFNAADLKFVGLIARVGPAPEEITVPGAIQYNPTSNILSIFDYGQMVVKTFDVDSALINKPYYPHISYRIPLGRFPDRYARLNDSIGIARLINMPDGSSNKRGFKQTLCHYNIQNGEISEFDTAGRLDKLKTLFAINPSKNRIVESAINNDIISIYDINGKKIRDIYGPYYDSAQVIKDVRFFTHITLSDDYIFALYSGSDDRSTNSYGRFIHIYDLDGNYIKTIDVGTLIGHISYEDTTNRIIMICEGKDFQLAYINLDEII